MKVAALDFGSNTFLLLIAEVSVDGVHSVLHDEARIVRLAQGIAKTKRFHPEALDRARTCLSEFAKVIAAHKVERVLACATAAARQVDDPRPLIDLASKFGIPVQIVPGEKEAELTFLGTAGDEVIGETILIDTGGASTELVFGVDGKIKHRVSMDIGSVNLSDGIVTGHPIASEELAKLNKIIHEKILSVHGQFLKFEAPRVVAVAGTATTLAAVDMAKPFQADLVDGYILSLKALRSWVKRLADASVEERKEIPGMDVGRADVLPVGALILMSCCQALNTKELEISVRGLRYGVAIAMAKGAI